MVRQLYLSSLFLLVAIMVSGGNKSKNRDNEILSIININENQWQSFIYDAQLYEERVDTLTKIKFWTLVMGTDQELMIVNEASSRRILQVIPVDDYNNLSDNDKDTYRVLLREEFGLEDDARIFATQGKSQFYQFRRAMPGIDRGIQVFLENEVDPWYAQSILLIESPGKLAKSNVGALGSFQLMAKVARKYGLQVDSKVDERKDFDRSAYGAAMLIKNVCLPYTRQMLNDRGAEYVETDLWFRLLVLHVYHAGAYNVKSALGEIDNDVVGMALIQTLWETESRGFRNASQNYTQVALASLLQLSDLIHENCVIYHSTKIPVAESKKLPGDNDGTSVAAVQP